MRCRHSVVALIAGLCLTVLAGGCGDSGWTSRGKNTQSKSPSLATVRLGGVAIVDMDEVAKQLGTDVVLVKQIKEGEASLNQQLQTIQASLRDRYQERVRTLNTNSSGTVSNPDAAAQKQQLAGLERELNLQLNESRTSAQKELKVYRQRLIQSFRDEIVPVAQEVAAERGLGVVITKNDTILLAFDDTHDITAALIVRLRANRAAGQQQRNSTASRPAQPSTTYR
jgi:Skp family chaperone for outer membrane proteins